MFDILKIFEEVMEEDRKKAAAQNTKPQQTAKHDPEPGDDPASAKTPDPEPDPAPSDSDSHEPGE